MKTKKQKNKKITPEDEFIKVITKAFEAHYYATKSESIKRGIARKKLLELKVDK